jgi:hypothetical protein
MNYCIKYSGRGRTDVLPRPLLQPRPTDLRLAGATTLIASNAAQPSRHRFAGGFAAVARADQLVQLVLAQVDGLANVADSVAGLDTVGIERCSHLGEGRDVGLLGAAADQELVDIRDVGILDLHKAAVDPVVQGAEAVAFALVNLEPASEHLELVGFRHLIGLLGRRNDGSDSECSVRCHRESPLLAKLMGLEKCSAQRATQY